MIIYKATNLTNGKVYIGQTINTLAYRQSQHIRDARNPKRKNIHFHNAICKYGADNFVFEEIDFAETQEELNEKEIYWIAFYHSNERDFGYNEDSGGKSGGVKSEMTKRKIGDTTLAKWADEKTAAKMMDGLKKRNGIMERDCKIKKSIVYMPILWEGNAFNKMGSKK